MKTIVLLVDSTFTQSLASEIARWISDVSAEGWTVIRHDVPRTDTPPQVKARILADYASDSQNVKAVFIIGHVAVPYSGNIAPDGHTPQHQGAYPCDGYYGSISMSGNWTDSTVNVTVAEKQANWNTPGDGKFDLSVLP